eukprot:6213692-Pleurochrysis_carterae.AAC.1
MQQLLADVRRIVFELSHVRHGDQLDQIEASPAAVKARRWRGGTHNACLPLGVPELSDDLSDVSPSKQPFVRQDCNEAPCRRHRTLRAHRDLVATHGGSDRAAAAAAADARRAAGRTRATHPKTQRQNLRTE